MMYPISYIDPVFRPPSEARSLILQVTNGCSYNQCTFCDMYTQPQKKFKPQPLKQIEQQLASLSSQGFPVRRVFLADGDAMALSTRRLKDILVTIKNYYPDCQRVSSYCLPSNLKNKSVEDLKELKQLGLALVYIGCESGDDEVLAKIEKGETYQSSLDALLKLQQAGIKRSVMILNGLGGPELSQQHAIQSARLMNDAQPEYLATLVLSLPYGESRFSKNFAQGWRPLTQTELFQEMQTLVETLELSQTIFRSDHASNYLVLKGILGKDKQKMLQQIHLAQHAPNTIPLRQEWQRGL
jgi:radical SAM superfamily enzyme YgiQ (UPF0313 family)